MSAACVIASALPTEVPPNFMTNRVIALSYQLWI
jgi:hypothetical protein